MKTLQQRIVQVPRDACALADAIFQTHVELLRHLTEPELIKSPEQCQKSGHARHAEPPCLPKRRIDFERNRSLGIIPLPIAIAGNYAEPVRAWAQICVDSFPGCGRLTPATVETVKRVSKANAFRYSKAQPRIPKRDSFTRRRNSN